jgi:hypothetical protein
MPQRAANEDAVGTPTSEPTKRRSWRAVTVLLAVLIAAGPAAWWVRDTGVYLWSTRRVTLTWQCTNGLFLPLSTGALHYRWWAQDPTPHGRGGFLTEPPTPLRPMMSTYHATGIVHFDSIYYATFHSKAGQTLSFVRKPAGTFYTAQCGHGVLTP